MANQANLTKFEVCVYKKDDVSHEDLIKWATEVYAPQVIPLMKKHGVVKWTQTILPPHFREPFRQTLKEQMGRPEWTVPDYDLAHTYYLPSMDVVMALSQEPKWIELEEEVKNFANMSVGHILVGHEIVQIDGNES